MAFTSLHLFNRSIMNHKFVSTIFSFASFPLYVNLLAINFARSCLFKPRPLHWEA